MTEPAPRGRVTIAIPKGRILGPLTELLSRAGLQAEGKGSLETALREESRALVRRAALGSHGIDFLLLKPDDVPTYVEYGAAHLGVCGRDVLVERDVDVYQPVDLALGKCRLVVAGRVGHVEPRSRLIRVATKYPRTTAAYFARKGTQVEVINVQGSVELAPLAGLSDVIVDLVETGKTLEENGLEVKEDIARISSVLLANRAHYKVRADAVGAIVSAVRGAVASS